MHDLQADEKEMLARRGKRKDAEKEKSEDSSSSSDEEVKNR